MGHKIKRFTRKQLRRIRERQRRERELALRQRRMYRRTAKEEAV